MQAESEVPLFRRLGVFLEKHTHPTDEVYVDGVSC